MDIGAPNVTEYFLLKKAMDTQIGVLNAEKTTAHHRHSNTASRHSTGLRHLDPDTDFKVKRIASRVNEALYMAANEPSLGLYRIQEHVYRTLPQLVERKNILKSNEKKIEETAYDLNLSMDVVDDLSKITNFTRIQVALRTAIEMKRNLNILQEQEKARQELDATKARQANRSISTNELAEGFICPVCYFAHTNQDDLILHWQKEHSLENYENDVFHEIELPSAQKELTPVNTYARSIEYTVKQEQDTTIIDIPDKEGRFSECEDVVRSIDNCVESHTSNTPENLIESIEHNPIICVNETNESSASSASSSEFKETVVVMETNSTSDNVVSDSIIDKGPSQKFA